MGYGGFGCKHLVKVDPGTAGWWISLAYALRRTESIEKAEAILLRAQGIHPKLHRFTLACYTSVKGRMEDAKDCLRHAIKLDKDIRKLLHRESVVLANKFELGFMEGVET